MENKAIKQARTVLEKISQDKHERYLAELREKHIMDQKAIRDAGYIKGKNAGIAEGISEGMKKKQLEIAKKMKEKNIEISIIKEITGLTKEEVENI